jgi:hypothetical protein
VALPVWQREDDPLGVSARDRHRRDSSHSFPGNLPRPAVHGLPALQLVSARREARSPHLRTAP